VPNKELSRRDRGMAPLRPELPTVPDAFRRTDYEGVIEEIIKGIQLRRYQKTQRERIGVLKQINEIQKECLALARNEADWQHFHQEDRLRQKRLDVQEMELDARMEDLLYERQRKIFERGIPPLPQAPPKPRDMVEEITEQLEQAIRTEAGVKEVFGRARERDPKLKGWLDEWEARVTWELRERKWF